jgi:agmatine/peptidylarginine deiminase
MRKKLLTLVFVLITFVLPTKAIVNGRSLNTTLKDLNEELLNNYRQIEKEKGKPWTKRLVKILEYHFDIVELKYDCIPSDESWCYLNYLETGSAIILPALSPKHDCDSDLAASKVFSRIFKKKTIRQVYARPLIKDGGALHCATWNLYL